MIEDFSNAPKSIAELRADRDHSAAKWTPRDALIAVLRQIDSGEINPSEMVIAYREQVPAESSQIAVVMAYKDHCRLIGMLEMAKACVLEA